MLYFRIGFRFTPAKYYDFFLRWRGSISLSGHRSNLFHFPFKSSCIYRPNRHNYGELRDKTLYNDRGVVHPSLLHFYGEISRDFAFIGPSEGVMEQCESQIYPVPSYCALIHGMPSHPDPVIRYLFQTSPVIVKIKKTV